MRLTQGIHRAVQLFPSRPALVSPERSYDWREFAQRIAKLAGAMRALGIRAGDRVAMLADNSPRYVEYYFAVLWAGGVLAPVNVRWAPSEMLHCLNDAEAKLLLVDRAHMAMSAALRSGCGSIRAVILADAPGVPGDADGLLDYETLLRDAPAIADAQRGGDDLAALFYTGGTTGRAKGVMLSHTNFLTNSMTALVNLGISHNSVHLHVSPLFHLAGGSRVFTLTLAGGTHAVVGRFDPDAFLGGIERFSVTVTVVVPTALNTLLKHSKFDDYDLSSLELLSYGASPMPESLLREAMRRLPGVRFLQSYGMTELSPVATMLEPEFHTFEGPNAGKIRSAGRAVFNADVAIMDAEDHPVETGEVGEICVRGPMVMQGYWRQPELTRDVLRGGWMHTGDAGYLDADGFLFLVDRIKDMIITGGENVYSAAVENVIYLYAGVHECAVIGIPSEQWGEAVHAIVVMQEGALLDTDRLVEHCREHLAGYECPKSIDVWDTELPKSGVGKILKAELRAAHWPDTPVTGPTLDS
jgi:long-chain acyl-CoA synthetase